MQDERVEVTSLLKGVCDEQREKKQAQFTELLGRQSLLPVTWPTPRALSSFSLSCVMAQSLQFNPAP